MYVIRVMIQILFEYKIRTNAIFEKIKINYDEKMSTEFFELI